MQYPLTLSEIDDRLEEGKQVSTKETWLIQQGIGDLDNKGQYWQFVNALKPRHGIAAPLLPPKTRYGDKESGRLFCFLPLPDSSGVPVHINGSFVLDTSRRGLWKNTSPEGELDDRSRWNIYLFKAIASSYANFVVQARHHYLRPTYKNWTLALNDLQNYYHIFPQFKATDINKEWNSLSCEVYKNLIHSNAKVLCVLVPRVDKKGAKLSVEWHPLLSKATADQVHFWLHNPGSERKIIHPILLSLGMNITPAPPHKMDCLNNILSKLHRDAEKRMASEGSDVSGLVSGKEEGAVCGKKNLCKTIPCISPKSVFDYYTKHSVLSPKQPCVINQTPFKDEKTFLVFVKYLLRIDLEAPKADSNIDATPTESVKSRIKTSTPNSFPGSPFSHFLLLSADGILQAFKEDCKVLNSEHSSLFPAHSDMFLHPILRVVNFNRAYFISPEDEEKDAIAPRILAIFEGTLPPALHNVNVVSNATEIIKKDRLSLFWKCFMEDEVFACYLKFILKDWTMLFTRDNRLFSTSNKILPAYFPFEPDIQLKTVCAIMQELQMPFLDRSVVIAHVDCPKLTDHDRILANFYYTNMHQALTTVSKNVSHIDTLIQYFSSARKPDDPTWAQQISSLPLFKDVLGEFIPIINKKAYVWPSLACNAGYGTWIHDMDVVFLQRDASWTMLGTGEHLKIYSISAEQTYLQYIFPKFNLLKEVKRYKHLEDIRQYIFSSNNNLKGRKIAKYMSDEERQKIRDAGLFVESLKALRCIGPDHSSLQLISAFCDHNITIFEVFSSEFQTLPEQLQSAEWHSFFTALGLKQALTQAEYLKLCNKVADVKVKNVGMCSKILLEYIFSEKIRLVWSNDTYFLNQVSRIAFVCTCDTSDVRWIAPGACQMNQLVPLNGAASVSLMYLMWTLRPIICLPSQCLYYNQDQETKLLLTNMNIVAGPNISDVVSNMKNICSQSAYANEALLDNYPDRLAAPGRTTLLSVMQENLLYLGGKMHTDIFDVGTIKDLPCIPVYCDLSNKEATKVVLVKPSSVLAYGCSIDEYHPFLQCVPFELGCSNQLLTEIGVKLHLDVHHMQIVLEKISIRSQGTTLDPNSKTCVQKAMEFLNSYLDSPNAASNGNHLAKLLTPLYLPDTNDILRLSTTMLYSDTFSYCGEMELDLSGTPYYHFDAIEDTYNVSGPDLCRLLPEQVRPLGMSIKCKQVPDEDCETVAHSDLSLSIEESLQHYSNSLAITKVYNKFLSSKVNDDDLEHLITQFFSLEIFTKENLQTQIILMNGNKEIGHMKSNYYLDLCKSPYVLYIDHSYEDDDEIVGEIAQHLCDNIFQKFPAEVSVNMKIKLVTFIIKYLKANSSKKPEILKRYRLEIKSKPSGFKVELGEGIPNCYYHRLDQDIYNIFRPMEYVGYEEREDHIIVAQIVHLVQSEDERQHMKRYLIYTRKDDEEGKVVSILDLYKFLKGIKKPSVPLASAETLALVPYNEEDVAINLRRSIYEGDIADIKERIRTELREIWKLDRELRHKAIRRLYLKWHPDKNLDNIEMAQEVFSFLQSEIEHLNRNEASSHSQCRSRGGGVSESNLRSWNRAARRQRETEDEEIHNAGPNPSPFDVPTNHTMPDEGWRWVKQSETDYEVLCKILSVASDVKGYSHVCFMAHQVAEKALKGGVYALCGLDGRGLTDHNLTRHSYALQTAVPGHQTQDLAIHSIPLESYYLDTRYPNRWAGYMDTPSDHFTLEQAEKSKDHAKDVLGAVKEIMPQL